MAPVCIYCGSSDFSKEHPLPRCCGNFKGYVTLDDRLCVECNGKCKILDEQLCRSGGESFFREYLRIGGRKRQNKINPFYRGSAGGGRLVIEGTLVGDTKPVSLEIEKGDLRELRHISLRAGGIDHVIPIPENMTPEQFRAAFDRLGLAKAEEAHVYADEQGIPWMESLLNTLNFRSSVEWLGGSEPVEYTNIKIEFTVTERYFRALAKIGFHYFLSKIPGFRGDEECFQQHQFEPNDNLVS